MLQCIQTLRNSSKFTRSDRFTMFNLNSYVSTKILKQRKKILWDSELFPEQLRQGINRHTDSIRNKILHLENFPWVIPLLIPVSPLLDCLHPNPVVCHSEIKPLPKGIYGTLKDKQEDKPWEIQTKPNGAGIEKRFRVRINNPNDIPWCLFLR